MTSTKRTSLKARLPKRVIGVTDLPKGAQIQIEAIAGNAEGTPPIG